MFLDCKHADGEDKLGGEKHLDDWIISAIEFWNVARYRLHRPRTIEVSVCSDVVTFNGPGNRPATTPAAAIAPRSSLMMLSAARVQLMLPMSAIATMTAGLNSPNTVIVSECCSSVREATVYLH